MAGQGQPLCRSACTIAHHELSNRLWVLLCFGFGGDPSEQGRLQGKQVALHGISNVYATPQLHLWSLGIERGKHARTAALPKVTGIAAADVEAPLGLSHEPVMQGAQL